jgi:hypothetical protein
MLPPNWKIHNVFHASLLTPYKETEQHGPNFMEPPPDIIEGEPEWEVEQVLQSRRFGRQKKKQYLVRWKGYSPAHDSWVDEGDIHAPELIQEFHDQHSTAVQSMFIRTTFSAQTDSPESPTPPVTPTDSTPPQMSSKVEQLT